MLSFSILPIDLGPCVLGFIQRPYIIRLPVFRAPAVIRIAAHLMLEDCHGESITADRFDNVD